MSQIEVTVLDGGMGKKGEALYYANVEHMDAAVGKLMAALDEMGVADDTLVFFTSDKGPEPGATPETSKTSTAPDAKPATTTSPPAQPVDDRRRRRMALF